MPSRDNGCPWIRAWIGPCGKQGHGGNALCKDHHGKRCVGCGALATQGCGHTGQFVCGAPICPNCRHLPAEGWVGFMGGGGHGRDGWRNGKPEEVRHA